MGGRGRGEGEEGERGERGKGKGKGRGKGKGGKWKVGKGGGHPQYFGLKLAAVPALVRVLFSWASPHRVRTALFSAHQLLAVFEHAAQHRAWLMKARPPVHEELEKLLIVVAGKRLRFLQRHSRPTHFYPYMCYIYKKVKVARICVLCFFCYGRPATMV